MGFKHATGDVHLDPGRRFWEYDPRDYFKLLTPIHEDKADVVFGSRFIGEPHRVLVLLAHPSGTSSSRG